jgi:3'-phosphoadenosine 5'-phosphosulfate (PAPS) 3'-phosphatase
MQIDAVTDILREAAEVAIVPRFRALADGDVTEKSAGEVVTVADRAAEDFIAPRLRALLNAPVVGEEAACAAWRTRGTWTQTSGPGCTLRRPWLANSGQACPARASTIRSGRCC